MAHESPDGDALGSLLGCVLPLQAIGRDVVCVIAGDAPFPGELSFLPTAQISRSLPADASARVLLTLDCGSEQRIATGIDVRSRFARIVNVDHHHDNSCFGDVNLVLGNASSTAEIVAGLLAEAGIELTPDACEALYVGLVTDTGRFQYANTTPQALRLAASLVERGIEPARLFALLYERLPLGRQLLLGIALSRARSELDGRLLVTWLERADFDRTGAADSAADGAADALRAVDGAQLAALIREPASPRGGRYKISLRSRADGVDSSAVARVAGGGGHRGAAGFSSDGTIDEIIAFLAAQVVAQTPA